MVLLREKERKEGTSLTGLLCRSPAALSRSSGENSMTGRRSFGPRGTTFIEVERRQLAIIYKAHTPFLLPLRPAAPAEERGRGAGRPTDSTTTRGRSVWEEKSDEN